MAMMLIWSLQTKTNTCTTKAAAIKREAWELLGTLMAVLLTRETTVPLSKMPCDTTIHLSRFQEGYAPVKSLQWNKRRHWPIFKIHQKTCPYQQCIWKAQLQRPMVSLGQLVLATAKNQSVWSSTAIVFPLGFRVLLNAIVKVALTKLTTKKETLHKKLFLTETLMLLSLKLKYKKACISKVATARRATAWKNTVNVIKVELSAQRYAHVKDARTVMSLLFVSPKSLLLWKKSRKSTNGEKSKKNQRTKRM